MTKINFQNNITKANADTFNTMQDNIENAINSDVVESGSNANGEYVKFVDGTLICTKTISGTLGGNALGNVYYSDHSVGDFAYTFTSKYAGYASVELNQYWCNLNGSNFTSVRVYRPNSGTATGNIRIMVIGRWK